MCSLPSFSSEDVNGLTGLDTILVSVRKRMRRHREVKRGHERETEEATMKMKGMTVMKEFKTMAQELRN